MQSGIKELFLSVMSESSLIIQIDMVILLAMSVISWSLIIYKFVGLSRVERRMSREYKAFQDARDLTRAMRSLGGPGSSSLYRVGYEAVQELKRLESAPLDNKAKSAMAMDNVRRALRQGVGSELSRLGSQLAFLGTCANTAPFLGLFGTVWGIMRSFHAIGVMKTASLAVVGPGIAEALVTTVVGLIVAIPAAIAYNLLLGLLSRIETVLVNFGGVFLNSMQRELSWNGDSE